MELNQLIITYSACFGLITFFLGLFLGHRLALGRDIRKERIVAAEPIRKWIREQKYNLEPYGNPVINEDELDKYRLTLNSKQLRKFDMLYKAYLLEIENSNNIKSIKLPDIPKTLVISGWSHSYIDSTKVTYILSKLDLLTQHR